MPFGRSGPLSKAIGGSIGLYKEWQADSAARKEQNSQAPDGDEHSEAHNEAHPAEKVPDEDAEDDDDDEDSEEEDGETWAQNLDAAQMETSQPEDLAQADFDEKRWLDRFLYAHPPPYEQLRQPLSMPVIIPERRPGAKTRGFVRAYAPILQDAGIDQDTWIEMLKGFEQSISKHKWFHAANAAVAVAEKVRFLVEGFSIIAKVVVMAIHVSIEASRRGYMNMEQNKFLDGLNDGFFKPRGLYAMVIKYNPKSDDPVEDVDISANTRQQVAKRDNDERSKWKNIYQGSAGKVRHEEEIPEFAPLEFPELDKLPEQQKQNAVKHFGHFLGEYYDRRGQAKFDAQHPDSKISGLQGEQQFASQYSDPNNTPANKGLVSTVSGGKIQRRGVVGKLTDRRNDRREAMGITRKTGKEGRKDRKNKRPLRRFLKEDTLYLMVVNMPTEEEIDLALKELEEASKQKGQQFDAQAIKAKLGLGDSVLGRRKQ